MKRVGELKDCLDIIMSLQNVKQKKEEERSVGTMLHGEVTNILFESLSIAIDDTIKNVTLVIGQKQIASRGGKQK